MTIEEIFNQISYHMIEGLMIHSQLTDYFGFLGFEGYQQCHLYHYFEESSNYKKLGNYLLKHCNRLLAEDRIANPNIIPADWVQYYRQQVTNTVRKTALQSGIEKWVNWEKETKKLYEKFYNELIAGTEVGAAKELAKYIKDVDYELAEAEQELLKLQSIDFSITDVMLEQKDIKKEYSKKLKEIKLC